MREQFEALAELCNINVDGLKDISVERNCVAFLARCNAYIDKLEAPGKKKTSASSKKKKGSRPPSGKRSQTLPTAATYDSSNNESDHDGGVRLSTRAKELEDGLKKDLEKVDDSSGMRARNIQLMQNLKKHQEQRTILDDFIKSQNKKMEVRTCFRLLGKWCGLV